MNNSNYSWLQLSDLHIFDYTDWNIMKEAYKRLAKVVHPDFLVVTGDFRHKLYNNDYSSALNFLNEIVDIFKIDKRDVFLVPGNHDTNDFPFRNEIIFAINNYSNNDSDFYRNYMLHKQGDLRRAFDEYHRFVKDFYGNNIADERTKCPYDVIRINWRDKLNIVLLNTALVSNGKDGEKEIIDIKALSELKVDCALPTIVLAHHSVLDLVDVHADRIPILLDRINARIYLCGDKHKLNSNGLEKKNIPNSTVPMIISGKSSNQPKDS